MDSLSRDDREKHLITRGNVDGIVSAAIFLNRYPASRVSFITSPTAGARALSMDHTSNEIYLADVALVPDVAEAMATRRDRQKVFLIDHHPTPNDSCPHGVKVINEGMSAAGVMYHFLSSPNRLKKIVAIADLVEYFETPILAEMMHDNGQQKVCEESRVLDFSWRLNIEDDSFRMQAAQHLSQGLWPSQVGPIKRRYTQVVNEQRWPKALARARSGLRVRGSVGIFDGTDKNRSLYGFGTRAIVEVAIRRGCRYAMMVNERKIHSSISIRSMCLDGTDVGGFVEYFTALHGLEGGGHPSSAGARIPVQSTHRFVDEFVSEAR
jgi:oligoribonuclease NrnB/cAMP/cGMP phosphodiesterase (DHH superfamily)